MSEFDYIIVGAGPAGCVLAARLSEDASQRVLLLEAGGRDRDPRIRVPAAFPSLFNSKHDWAFKSAPEDSLDGRRLAFPRGRVLGGSSSINAQMYLRGHRLDYDAWDLTGWRYDDLLPFFRRAECNQRGADAYHGGDGPWRISDLRDPNPLTRAFLEAADQNGIRRNPDLNGPELEGAGLTQVMQDRGRRFSAADAYLLPARHRTNLTVVTDALVTGLTMVNGRADGVMYRHRRHQRVARAGREILLCAGAIGSPQLLMLSGIGPAEHLRAHGIDVVCDLPGVGQNLQDHMMAPVRYATSSPVSMFAARSARQAVRYLLTRRGMLTSNIAEAAAFLRSTDSLAAPDIELILAAVLFPGDDLAPPSRHGFTIGAVVLQPRSRGSVALSSADPATPPAIRPSFLTDPADLRTLAHGVAAARRIASARAFDDLRGDELDPGSHVKRPQEIERYARAHVVSIGHPVGTCRMGTDALAVVDPDLRVRGIRGLRVVDASVMPTITRGHTCAPTTAIAERAADLIRATVGAARARHLAAASAGR